MIDVCICTHGGAADTMERVLTALTRQTLDRARFRVVVIDNANQPPIELDHAPFDALRRAGVEARVVREPKLGVAHARIAALRQTDGDAVVFVDDDNVLAPDFLERACAILAAYPKVGCFSGRIGLPDELEVPDWIRPLLGSLAVRDVGPEPIVEWFRGHWAPWVPAATASMVLRREVADSFLLRHADREEFARFGRKGRGMMSGEDFLIALSAADAGMKCGYFPELFMTHWIRPERLAFSQMARLMICFGITDVLREEYLNVPPQPFGQEELFDRLFSTGLRKSDPRARFCHSLYSVVYISGRARRLLRAGQPIVVDLNERPNGG
ncbi:MAG: glycosyltransferase [Deltaproteobacteria bacterium]|nr:glycosyltransferase [Deltaproteobacteria bacterium]